MESSTTCRWEPIASVYCSLQAGSIDGTDSRPHDRAVERAMKAIYKPNKNVQGDPECTLFVGRLDTMTSEDKLKKIFSKYGDILQFRLVRDIVTGISKQYAFIEYSKHRYAMRAKKEANHTTVDGRDILVDWECERTLPKWIPRRLGGGFGGKKESGQLRFGGTERPFRRPIIIRKQHNDRDEEQDRGIDRHGDRNHDRQWDDGRHDRQRDSDRHSRNRDGDRHDRNDRNRDGDRHFRNRDGDRHDRNRDDDRHDRDGDRHRNRDGDRYYDKHRGEHRERGTDRRSDIERDTNKDRNSDRTKNSKRERDSNESTRVRDNQTPDRESTKFNVKTQNKTEYMYDSDVQPGSTPTYMRSSQHTTINIKQEKD